MKPTLSRLATLAALVALVAMIAGCAKPRESTDLGAGPGDASDLGPDGNETGRVRPTLPAFDANATGPDGNATLLA